VKWFVELKVVWRRLGAIATPCVTPCGLSPQEGGGVAVVCNMVSVVTDLGISELLCQVQANQVGTVQVTDGLGLVRGRGNQDLVTHVWFVWYATIIGTGSDDLGSVVDGSPTGRAAD